MKKSEAVNKLAEAFYDCLDIPNDSYVSQKDPGNFLLEVMLKLGMRLPTYPTNPPKYDSTGELLENVGWEPETPAPPKQPELPRMPGKIIRLECRIYKEPIIMLKDHIILEDK